MSRVGIEWKKVDKGISEKNGMKCRQCRCSVTNEAIFQIQHIVVNHTHAIHLLYHRVEGDLHRREYAL